jgi:DNA-binding winged helix-turn-helix (wHTH) protein
MRFVSRQFEIDEDGFEVRRDGVSLHVEPRVLELMIYLLRNRHRMVPKREILECVWYGYTVGGSVIDRCVCIARKTLADPSIIRTVYARGYRWAAPVAIIDSCSEPPHPVRVDERARAG